MAGHDIDVVGVGNAIVDVLAKADDAFLAAHGIPKGGMILIDEAQAANIYGAMAAAVEISGGSAANSIACIASLGGKGGFVGKVAKTRWAIFSAMTCKPWASLSMRRRSLTVRRPGAA